MRTIQLRPVPVVLHVPTMVLLTSEVKARTSYRVIADPPSDAGGVQLIVTRPLPATPPVIVGAPGIAVPDVDADIGVDSGLEPMALVANTVNQYCVEMFNPMTVHVSVAVVQERNTVGVPTVGFEV